MKKYCQNSKDNQHTFKKIGVSRVDDEIEKSSTLFTFGECIYCGHRIATFEVFGKITLDMWKARDYGNLPDTVISIKNVICGQSIVPKELNKARGE